MPPETIIVDYITRLIADKSYFRRPVKLIYYKAGKYRLVRHRTFPFPKI